MRQTSIIRCPILGPPKVWSGRKCGTTHRVVKYDTECRTTMRARSHGHHFGAVFLILGCLLVFPFHAAAAPADVEADANSNANVTVERLNGDHVAGQLVSIENGELTIASENGPQTIRISGILSLVPQQRVTATAEAAKVWLQMTDGSRVQGKTIRESAGTTVVELLSGNPWNCRHGRSAGYV